MSMPFLTAEWRDLVMLNWPVAPSALAPFVPSGTALDLWQGRCYASLVAFRFLSTRVRGVSVPGHRDFEEINLRFYVTRREGAEVRRGVVFIKEIVPRSAIAFVARALYGEPYVAMPTASEVRSDASGKTAGYSWRQDAVTHSMSVECGPDAAVPAEGTREAFIAEHYWGYSPHRGSFTSEYRVVHPPWAVRPAKVAICAVDAARLYGPDLGRALSGPPEFSFLAEGSAIEVHPGRKLAL